MTDWIPWNGGPCPIPDAKAGEYEIKFRDGEIAATGIDAIVWKAWIHEPLTKDDIIAYRLLTPKADPDALIRELRNALSRVPNALGSAFSAGVEEREHGSARRQEKLLAPVEQLRSDISDALDRANEYLGEAK